MRINCYFIVFLLILSFLSQSPATYAQENQISNKNLKAKGEEILFLEDIKKESGGYSSTLVETEIEGEITPVVPPPILKGAISELNKWGKLKKFIKGEPARNSIMLGMWSKHSGGSEYREVNNLGGLQYKGLFLGTFANSHSDQVVALTVARTVYKKELSKNLLFDAGYKIGPMYGYKEHIPNLGGFSILPALSLGLSYRGFGAALNLFPANAVSVHTFINIDAFNKKR